MFEGQRLQTFSCSFLETKFWFHCWKPVHILWLLIWEQGFPGGIVFTCLPMKKRHGTQVWSLGREDPLELGMATHSSILVWRISWVEEPGRLQSMGLQRVGHDWAFMNVVAAADKSLQLCLTLCDPIDNSPSGFPVPSILQARTLEWVAISFSNVMSCQFEEHRAEKAIKGTSHPLSPSPNSYWFFVLFRVLWVQSC